MRGANTACRSTRRTRREAITKAMRIRANPLLTGRESAGRGNQSLPGQPNRRREIYTRNSADSRRARAENVGQSSKPAGSSARSMPTKSSSGSIPCVRSQSPRSKGGGSKRQGTPGSGSASGVKHRELRHDHPRILRLAGGGEQAAGEPAPPSSRRGSPTSAEAAALLPRESKWTSLVSECLDREMKFILYCGFHAGLRKGEIVQARPQWFDLKLNIILHCQETQPWGIPELRCLGF